MPSRTVLYRPSAQSHSTLTAHANRGRLALQDLLSDASSAVFVPGRRERECALLFGVTPRTPESGQQSMPPPCASKRLWPRRSRRCSRMGEASAGNADAPRDSGQTGGFEFETPFLRKWRSVRISEGRLMLSQPPASQGTAPLAHRNPKKSARRPGGRWKRTAPRNPAASFTPQLPPRLTRYWPDPCVGFVAVPPG